MIKITEEKNYLNRLGFKLGFNTVNLLINCLNSKKDDIAVYEDKRFTFETLSKKDIELLKSIYFDPDANATVVPVTKPTQKGVKKKLQTFIDLQNKTGHSCYKVFDKNSNAYIGIAGLTAMDEEGNLELNCALKKEFRNQRIGSELAKSAINYAKEQNLTEKLYATCLSYNTASHNILINNGFEPDGILKMPGNNFKDTYILIFKYTGTPNIERHPRFRSPESALKELKENLTKKKTTEDSPPDAYIAYMNLWRLNQKITINKYDNQ